MKYTILFMVAWAMLFSCQQQPTTEKSAPVVDPILKASSEAPGFDSLSSQAFSISIREEEMVVGDQGTVLLFPKNCFLDESGNPVNEDVEVVLKEASTLNDLVKARISTQADGRLLATAGSFYWEATSKGNRLQVNPNVGVFVGVPSWVTKDPEMRLFKGEIQGNDINWRLEGDGKEDEMPQPGRPTLQKPPELEVVQALVDLQKVRRILLDIDNGNMVLKGNQYVSVLGGSGTMNWHASFIEKCRKWEKYESQKEALYLKRDKVVQSRNAKKKLAWRKYKELMANYQKELEAANAQYLAESKDMTTYEFRLATMGWYNCDKFVNTPLVTYTGEVRDRDNMGMAYTRVHLVSVRENIHLTTVASIEGTYSFNFPKNVPFEILAFRGEEKGKQKFLGKSNTLEPVVLEM